MQITESWRANKLWVKHLGRKGVVISVSMMEVSASDQTEFLPYAYLLVELATKDKERISLMGVAHQNFVIGDQVEIVLRKIKNEAKQDIIIYGLKAQKI